MIIQKLFKGYESPIESSDQRKISFHDYPVTMFKGNIRIPKGYTHKNAGWVDEMNKIVDPLKINFTGQYYITLHSCGAQCRYYTVFNLQNGQGLSKLAENLPSSPESE
ncbi:unnamed protein product [Commensalibacter communis]|uniref:hypothetical protein n=1 Tax=Commensalibacter communis TaxID=2972786 RepID=UPI0022FF7ACA|nr:hypothetical protein [Commensalibacter communis]CAI3931090.1 unnamed protein product [Commensalibacter communis]